MMKQIAHFANGDRNEMARKLADGIHPMVIWFSAGVAAAYDKDGNLESRWEEHCPLNDGEERYILEENELIEDAAQFVEVENPSEKEADSLPDGDYDICTLDEKAIEIVRGKLPVRANGKRKEWYYDGNGSVFAALEIWEDGGKGPNGEKVPVMLMQVWSNGKIADCLEILSQLGLDGCTVYIEDMNGHVVASPTIKDVPAWPDESTTETLTNIHGDLAVIYYWDDSFEYDACRGYEIFPDGEQEKGLGMVPCGNADTAYAILSRKGFRY